MSKKKTTKKFFTLREEGDEVWASLDDPDDCGIKMAIHQVPKVRVRAPRPTKEHLAGMAKAWAHDPMYETDCDWLEDYIKHMNKQIVDHLQDVRRSMKRIQSLSHCIGTAKEIINEKSTGNT